MTHFVEFQVISNQATNEIRSQEFIFKIVDIPEIMYCPDTKIDGFNQANLYLRVYQELKKKKTIATSNICYKLYIRFLRY